MLQQLLEGRTLEVNARIRLRDDKDPRDRGKPRFRVEVERDDDEIPEDAE